jgi:hypothetical protein
MKTSTKQIVTFTLMATALGVQSASAATISWTGAGDGTSWINGANWSSGQEPQANDEATIGSGVTVTYDRTDTSSFPNNPLTLNVDGTFELGKDILGYDITMRNFGVDINVGSTGTIDTNGQWLELRGGSTSLTFDSGASYIQNSGNFAIYNSGNTIGFNLDAGGFSTLSSNVLSFDSGSWAGTTIDVAMGSYSGGAGTIVLWDFASNANGLTNTDFQNDATLNVDAASGYEGSYLQWNDSTSAIELVAVVPVPEPSSFALIGGCLALASVMLRRRS